MEIRKLNTLRGLAALIVVLSHYCNESGKFAYLLGEGAGQYGVMLFFLLSGFLMALLYLDKPCNSSAISSFLIARVARVLPLYLFVVIGSFALLSAGIGTGIVYEIRSGADLLSHVLMLSGKSVLWTIPPEIQFYVLFVGLWKLYSLHSHYLWCAIGLLFASGVLIDFQALSYTPLDIEVHTRLVSALPFFLVGMVLGNIYYRHGESHLQSHWFVLLLAMIPLLYPGMAATLFGRTWRLWQDLEPLLMVALIFAGLVFMVPRGGRLLESGVGDFLGRVSFSLYLLHIPVLNLLKPYIQAAPWLMFPVFLGISLAVSALSFAVIETPSRRHLRSWLAPATRPADPRLGERLSKEV